MVTIVPPPPPPPLPLARTLKPGPLPNNPFSPLSEWVFFSAFIHCKSLESLEDWSTFSSDIRRQQLEIFMLRTSPQVAGRTLGYALIYAPPHTTSRDCVAREINGCNGDLETLAGLAHLYIFGLMRIFKNPNGPTPFISPDLTPSCRAVGDEYYETVDPRGSTPPWLRDQLLLRDDYRCALSPKLDATSVGDSDVRPGETAGTLHVAHIISQSLATGVDGMTPPAAEKLGWASSTAAVLDRFTGIEIKTVLPDLDLHSPLNTMMLSTDAHELFDASKVWLTPSMNEQCSPIADTYIINIRPGRLTKFGLFEQACFRHHVQRSVGSQDADEDKDDTITVPVPPPSPQLLEIHAACATIAYMSGAAGVLANFYDGDEDGRMFHGLSRNCWDMALNPAAAKELKRALFMAQVVVDSRPSDR